MLNQLTVIDNTVFRSILVDFQCHTCHNNVLLTSKIFPPDEWIIRPLVIWNHLQKLNQRTMQGNTRTIDLWSCIDLTSIIFIYDSSLKRHSFLTTTSTYRRKIIKCRRTGWIPISILVSSGYLTTLTEESSLFIKFGRVIQRNRTHDCTTVNH